MNIVCVNTFVDADTVEVNLSHAAEFLHGYNARLQVGLCS